MFSGRVVLTLASMCVVSLLGYAQTTEGARIFTANNSTQTVNVQQSGSGAGLISSTPSTGSVGAVFGHATATTGRARGVWGAVSSANGWGVLGENRSGKGGIGVGGFSGTNGVGVFGSAVGTAVQGFALCPNGAINCGVNLVAIHGLTASDLGVAGLFENNSDCGGCTNVNLLVGRQFGANVFRVDVAGNVYANAYKTGGADFAESVAVRGRSELYSAGDLMAIDASGKRQLKLTGEPYSTLVAGVYSTKPGIVASPRTMGAVTQQEVPLAVVGIVPTKVTAENGAINTGDLLVSSSTPGRAMKGTDRTRMVGAVIGKALEPLPAGQKEGTIQVLVTLQ
jgi:hypothetical protein